MPPRKSNVSVVSANGEASAPATQSTPKEKKDKEKDKDDVAIEIKDLTMPRTMIQRLAKGVLPASTQLQKDAVTALAKSATVFVSHIAGAASDQCAATNRRTVNPNDVFAALRETEHADMVPRLERELAKWVEVNTNKRNEYRRKMKESKESKEGADGEEGDEETAPIGESINGGVDGERAAKRMKGTDGQVAAGQDEDDVMDVDDDEEDGQDEGEDEDDEDGNEDEDEDEEEDDDEHDESEMDPAAAQLERESRAVNADDSEEESD